MEALFLSRKYINFFQIYGIKATKSKYRRQKMLNREGRINKPHEETTSEEKIQNQRE